MGRPEGAPAPQQPVLVLDMEGGANGADPSALGFARLQVNETDEPKTGDMPAVHGCAIPVGESDACLVMCPAMLEEQKVFCCSLTLDEAMVRELGKGVLACRALPEGFSPAFIYR